MNKYNLLAMLLLFLPTALLAEAPVAKKSNVYSIELILFKQDGSMGNETWPKDPILPTADKARAVLQPSNSKNSAMESISYTLRKSGLTPLVHLKWGQSVAKWKSNDWRWFEGKNLHGLIRVTKGRFLHIDTDLIYTDPMTGRQYPVQLERKMRSKELHYVDHPMVGMLVKIYPPR